MDTKQIYTRLKIGLSMVVALAAGKWAGSLDPENYSVVFSIVFLAGVIATQGLFKLVEILRKN